MARGLSFLSRRTETGGAGEEALNSFYRQLVENVRGTGEDDLTLEKILEPNPRNSIYAPPGEPTLAITKPRFLGRAFATAPQVLERLKGVDARAVKNYTSKIIDPGGYLKSLKRQIQAIPDEAFKGIKDVGKESTPGFRASYQASTRKIGLNPSYPRKVSEIAHEIAHDWTRYPPARLPLATKRKAIEVGEIHDALRAKGDYDKLLYPVNPAEITARMMGGIARAWPSKKAIPIKAYDKLFDAALTTSLKNVEKRWPQFYRDVLGDLPWKKAEKEEADDLNEILNRRRRD